MENLHLSNVTYSENIKRQFKVGQTLDARVWAVTERGVFLTIKEALVKSDLCLSEYNESARDKQFPGVVAFTKFKGGGALVVFYGELKGFLPGKYMLQNIDNDEDGVFFCGQVVSAIFVKMFYSIFQIIRRTFLHRKIDTNFLCVLWSQGYIKIFFQHKIVSKFEIVRRR